MSKENYLCYKKKGHGLADLLWDEITNAFESIFWNSNHNDPLNKWYLKKAHGNCESNDYIMFWYGYGMSPNLIDYINNLKTSFNNE